MNTRATHIFYLLLFILSARQANGQFLKPPVNIASPNAATLGQFGEIPVSLFTGLPSIDIPLHTFKQGSIQIPLTLSYHASGVRPDQHPGWTGLNWNLSTGGSISRKINDLPDEYDYAATYKGERAGYYFNHGITSAANWDTKNYIFSLMGINNGDKQEKDTEPDEYSFNFLNYSGKFYLDHQGQWTVRANASLKVTFDGAFIDAPFIRANGINLKTFKQFTITDEAGIEYTFGNTTDAIEYSIPFFGQMNSHWIANTWHLTRIKLVNGQQITFTYDSAKLSMNGLQLRNEWICSMYISLFYRNFSISGGPTDCWEIPRLIGPYGPYRGELIAPVYLASIEGVNEKIVFNRSTSTELRYRQGIYDTFYERWIAENGRRRRLFPFLADENDEPANDENYPNLLNNLQWRKLDNIQIFSKGTTLPIKQVDFTYNNQPTERLTLLSVQQKSSGEQIPPYRFFYNTSVALPDYLADHTDHWGFYNGNKTYTYYMNPDAAALEAYYDYRQPDAAYLQAGMLNKIVYPTGGRTEFQFEPHTYAKGLNEERNALIAYPDNPIAGGLRIKKITHYASDNTQNPLEKTYYYVTNYNASVNSATLPSSGVLGGQAKYFWPAYIVYANNDPSVRYAQSVFSSHSVLPASNNSQGSHIGYSEVVEKYADGSYTIRKYTNFDNGHLDEPLPANSVLQPTRTIYDPYIDKSLERGHLLSEETRTPQDQPLSRKTISYQAVPNREVRSISATYFRVCPRSFAAVLEGYAHKYYTYQYKPAQEHNYVYNQNDASRSVATSTQYQYNAYGQPAVVRTTQSNNATLATIYKYPFDYTASAMGGTMGTLQTRHILNCVIEQRATRNGAAISGTVTEYNADGQPVKVYQLETSVPLTSGLDFNPAQINPNPTYYQQRTTLTYDAAKNLSSQQAIGDVPVSYLWGYNNTYPIAEVKNAVAQRLENYPVTTNSTLFFRREVNDARPIEGQLDQIAVHSTQTVNFTVRVDHQGSTISPYVVLRLIDVSTGRVVLLRTVYASEGTVTLNQAVSAGTYHLAYSGFPRDTESNNAPAGELELRITTNYIGRRTLQDVVHTSFEEDIRDTNPQAHTGNISHLGQYTIPRPASNGQYVLSYWQKPITGGSWTYQESLLNIEASSTDLIIGDSNSLIDEVRLYPRGAQMNTYTYHPLFGILSQTDQANLTTYYEYDTLGRLKFVRDHKRNIVKNFQYWYKQ